MRSLSKSLMGERIFLIFSYWCRLIYEYNKKIINKQHKMMPNTYSKMFFLQIQCSYYLIYIIEETRQRDILTYDILSTIIKYNN